MPALLLVVLLAPAVLLQGLAEAPPPELQQHQVQEPAAMDDECAALQVRGTKAKAEVEELLDEGPGPRAEYLQGKGTVKTKSVKVLGLQSPVENPSDGDTAGEQRQFSYYVPLKYNASKPPTLWLYFAGTGGDVACNMKSYGQYALAQEKGFILVGPVAKKVTRGNTQTRWRPGQKIAGGNDVKFVLQIIDWFQTQTGKQPAKVIANGFSLGGGMVYRLMCDQTAAQRISFGGILGGRPWWEISICGPRPQKMVPFIHLHGSKDGSVNYKAQYDRWLNKFSRLVSKCVSKNRRGIGKAQLTLNSPHVKDTSKVTCERAVRCDPAGGSVFCTIKDMGHDYPYAYANLAAYTTGPPRRRPRDVAPSRCETEYGDDTTDLPQQITPDKAKEIVNSVDATRYIWARSFLFGTR